jgi:O-acetyl-ADP-ribose deacetylase (regulator of RNase III)
MRDKNQWTNQSVQKFAGDQDPVAVMESKARELALNAIDDGWAGPPYDLIALARWRNLEVKATPDIPDARIVPKASGEFVLEYNPTRPRGRLRFSIAHEIAHTLFADCADEIRNREHLALASDGWQLEVLCNIGAAELLMPVGSFSGLTGQDISIDTALELRKKFDTSLEACLLRMVKLTDQPCAAFCASKHSDGGHRIDYVISSSSAELELEVGFPIPRDSAILGINAIGYTQKVQETWGRDVFDVECVGLAPYPGSSTPRVVGILKSNHKHSPPIPELKEIRGDALEPAGIGPKLIAHVIPNVRAMWGGGGFASAVRKKYPQVFEDFKRQISATPGELPLGEVFASKLNKDLVVVHMVAQRGIGDRGPQRLRLSALATCLTKVGSLARDLDASVHMPRIGTGHGGANWTMVREMVVSELSDKGVPATVYTLPD